MVNALITALMIKLAPQVGFEPTADRLTADCSTTELLWNKFKNGTNRNKHCLLVNLTPLSSSLFIDGWCFGVTRSLILAYSVNVLLVALSLGYHVPWNMFDPFIYLFIL